jgi:hypothetical protein
MMLGGDFLLDSRLPSCEAVLWKEALGKILFKTELKVLQDLMRRPSRPSSHSVGTVQGNTASITIHIGNIHSPYPSNP